MIAKFRIAAEKFIGTPPEPEFSLKLGWVKNYEEMFANNDIPVSDEASLYEDLKSSRRIILCGKGGTGKTTLLRRFARRMLAEECALVIINLKDWSEAWSDHWNNLTTSDSRFNFLVANMALPALSVAELDLLDVEVKRIVIVDGLNEVISSVAQQILFALDDAVRFNTNLSVLVTDRLVRRELDFPERWRLLRLLPFSEAEIQNILQGRPEAVDLFNKADSSQKRLLQDAYFLDQFYQDPEISSGKAEELRRYFLEHALNDEELSIAAKAAYEMYQKSSRTFSLEDFQENSSLEIVEKLQNAGILIVNGENASFDHHLKHDFLVATYLAESADRWTRENFRTASFSASSFDAISLLMEQIVDTASADLLLRSLYDWNVGATCYALAEGRYKRVSESLRVAILALIAERMWDRFEGTSTRCRDFMHYIDEVITLPYLESKNLDELLAYIRKIDEPEEWFNEWRELFTSQTGAEATDHQLEYLLNIDPVLGWTASNVLKRLRCNKSQLARIRNWCNDEREVVRWRCVHTLGAFGITENVEVLVDKMADSDDVSYGAIRSLVEVAVTSNSKQIRRRVTKDLERNIKHLVRSPRSIRLFGDALFPREAPSDWGLLFGPLVQITRMHVGDVDAEDWDRITLKFFKRFKVNY